MCVCLPAIHINEPLSLFLISSKQDLLSAMGHTKHGNTVANEHRKKAASLPFRLAGYVTGNTGVNWVKGMTPVELHAELVYAESLFEKARTSGILRASCVLSCPVAH